MRRRRRGAIGARARKGQGHAAVLRPSVPVMGQTAYLVMTLVFWGVPIYLLIVLFRSLATIVDGIRALNRTNERLLAAVEAMAQERTSNDG